MATTTAAANTTPTPPRSSRNTIVATAMATMATTSSTRCSGRGTTWNAASGPSAVAASRITPTPSTTGTSGCSLWIAWEMRRTPRRYSTTWWIQNGSRGAG